MGIVTTLGCVLLTFAFIMAGSAKISDALAGPDVHREMVGNFKQYAKLFQVAKFGTTAEQFRLAVGGAEIVLALLLWIMPRVASLGIAGIMVGAIYTHVLMEDPQEKLIPPAVLLAVSLLVAATAGTPKRSGAAKKRE
jgi:uncharacterized membrane protein YphA (DoxX/SURF4 family)